MDISRRHKTRNSEEAEELYNYIYLLVQDVQGTDDKAAKEAITCLVELFKPKIYKVVKFLYPVYRSIMELDDFVQECHIEFIALVMNYNPELSKFSHYIDIMLHQNVRSHIKQQAKHLFNTVDISDMELSHPDYADGDASMQRFLAHMYSDEYIKFITAYSKKATKTDTLKVVCDKYFLGNNSCKEIAEELNISYHAVYDYITKIKKELNYFIRHNPMFDYYFAPDGHVILKEVTNEQRVGAKNNKSYGIK